MTPQELKNSILQLAIQGKLVEQRLEEGTAEELYQQIQAEKQRLIKEGKIKKEKPLPEISEDEIPFDIPESWKWVRVIDIVYLSSGNQYSECSDGILYIKVADMSLPENEYEICTSTRKANVNGSGIIPTGSIIFPKRGGAIATNKKRLVLREPICVDSNIMVMTVIYEDILPYLYKWFSSIDLGKLATGTSVPQINNKDIYPLLVPLPPLAEQKRIVAKIEELLPYVDRYEKAWNKLEELNKRFPTDLQKSILQLAIQGKLVEQRPEEGTAEELYQQIQAEKQRLIKEGKIKKEKPLPEITEDEIPFDIPENWKWVKLGEIGYTNIGLTYSPQNQTSDGTIVLRSNNIRDGQMDYEDIVRVNMDIPENKMCHIGDILICARNGSKRLVGKAAIVDREGMSFGAFMAVYRSICNPYVLHVINSAYFRNSLLEDTGTTTINQITQDMLKNALIPLPPLAEQKRIVKKLEEILPLCEILKRD
jgi:type I restriction enzyme S subunit